MAWRQLTLPHGTENLFLVVGSLAATLTPPPSTGRPQPGVPRPLDRRVSPAPPCAPKKRPPQTCHPWAARVQSLVVQTMTHLPPEPSLRAEPGLEGRDAAATLRGKQSRSRTRLPSPHLYWSSDHHCSRGHSRPGVLAEAPTRSTPGRRLLRQTRPLSPRSPGAKDRQHAASCGDGERLRPRGAAGMTSTGTATSKSPLVPLRSLLPLQPRGIKHISPMPDVPAAQVGSGHTVHVKSEKAQPCPERCHHDRHVGPLSSGARRL